MIRLLSEHDVARALASVDLVERVAEARVFVDARDAALVASGDIVCGIAEGRFDQGLGTAWSFGSHRHR